MSFCERSLVPPRTPRTLSPPPPPPTHPPTPSCPGLLGDGFPWLLELAQRKVVQPGAAVVPAAATVYCMGIEALTGHVAGFDMSPINKYRWVGAGGGGASARAGAGRRLEAVA
jgi:hypothetical protein